MNGPKLDLNDQKSWMRGNTPDNIDHKCLELCQQYIGSVWLRVCVQDITVKRITGGLTNQMYYCAINKPDPTVDKDIPQEVAVRLYGAKHFTDDNNGGNERLTDTVVDILVSGTLGPKTYGVFESGSIQKYYKHRHFRGKEQENPKLVDQLARKLARVHALDVPIKRHGNWISETFDKLYELFQDKFDIQTHITNFNCDTLKQYDLKRELDWLKQAVLDTGSPICFTHIDFRGSNIMVTEPDDQIVLCDFEYSKYGFRGTDFGAIFAEWNGRLWSDVNTLHDFPDDQTIRPFIESYISESIQLKGKQFMNEKCNSFDNILKEVKVFSLLSNMFFVVMILKSDDPDKESFVMFSEKTYKNYHHLKQLFKY